MLLSSGTQSAAPSALFAVDSLVADFLIEADASRRGLSCCCKAGAGKADCNVAIWLSKLAATVVNLLISDVAVSGLSFAIWRRFSSAAFLSFPTKLRSHHVNPNTEAITIANMAMKSAGSLTKSAQALPRSGEVILL